RHQRREAVALERPCLGRRRGADQRLCLIGGDGLGEGGGGGGVHCQTLNHPHVVSAHSLLHRRRPQGRKERALIRTCRFAARPGLRPGSYSHSIVPGGFEVMSSTTRLTSRSSLIIREAIVSSRS